MMSAGGLRDIQCGAVSEVVDSHQHHFEERAVFVGRGVMTVGANETNTHGHTHTSEHNR